MIEEKENWDLIIKPKQSMFSVDFKALWRYRDLLMLFVRRDFVSVYKQTILGPIWFFIQPVLTTLTYLIVFYFIAEIKTDGLPPVLFYMSGIVLWNYFSECLLKTSETFTANATIFGKVYFPRLIVPLSIVVSNLIRLGIQLLLLIGFWLYFYFTGAPVQIHSTVLLLPLLLLLMAGHGLAFGIIISSLTTKYRDLKFLVQFGIQLLMYASPVVYPLSKVPEQYKWILLMNPMTSIIETFKYSFLGVGVYNPMHLVWNFILLIVVLTIGLLLFNRVEKSFMDTV
jgi:homopolymeric O-antigen transport system permease protein